MSAFPLSAIVESMRPRQWTKNAVVLAAFFFALGDPSEKPDLFLFWRAAVAAALFCLLSGAVYLVNDCADAELDRCHPLKRNRPVASGRLPVGTAMGTAAVLLAVALSASWLLSRHFAGLAAAYAALQLGYSFLLKHRPILDVMAIAAGFVLRAAAGAAAIPVHISPWLIVCAFLLSLFLALCKRRSEKVADDTSEGHARQVIRDYDEKLLDQLIAIVSAATIVSYAVYTLSPDTVQRFGSAALIWTLPFVIFGLFRYLDLVYRHDKGGQPEQILLTDRPLILNLLLYGATVFVLMLTR